ncbi:hypothetical protein QFZ23_004232 [Arthrobacter globiformis]|uniref:hypothetical protein n=1 Tax=Arthrobacter globiformis TaxID=1665 RepID=UPI002780FA53|nr:hypothetical protein [Arthrobacter globiformis]MDQ1060331.1 hypothetical protein [Arthrobacter globiformis]
MSAVAIGRLQGAFLVVNGLWPLVHMPSFEAVFGPKTDKWLVRTVGGLLLTNGLAQLRAGSSPGDVQHARQLGIGTAATLAAADFIYVGNGTLSRMYLLDAAAELLWISLWRRQRRAELP